MALVSNECQGYLLGLIVCKFWEPQSPAALRVYLGLYWDSFTISLSAVTLTTRKTQANYTRVGYELFTISKEQAGT